MKKIKLTLILCLILTVLGLAGCKSAKENDNDMQNNNDTNTNYGNTRIPEQKTDSHKEVANNESDHVDTTRGDDVLNISNHTELIIKDASLDNYIEKRIFIGSLESVPKESFASSVYNKDGYIEHYLASDVKGDTIVWKYTLNDDDTLSKEEATWLNQLKNKIDHKRIIVFMGEDDNYYAHYIESGERSRLVKKEDDGFIEIPIIDWDITEDRDFYMIIDQVAVLKNGNIVMASRGKKCYIYDKDSGEIIDIFPCGQYYSMITKDNYVIVLDEDNKSALIYDSEQGTIVNKIYGNFSSETLFFVDDDTLYACSRQGIMKTRFEQDSWELVLESGTFRFANQDPLRLYVKNSDFYILYHNDLYSLMKYTERTEEDKITDELKIYSLRDNTVIREVIIEFQLKHPEIQVTYEVGEIESGSTALSDSIRTLNTKIMNGEGPDIFLLEGLPMDSYIEKGILADLQDEIKEYRTELHQGILNEFVMEDKSIYMLPISFSLPIFYTVPESEKGIYSLNDLVDVSESMNEPLTRAMTFDDAVYLLYNYYPPRIISEKNEILTNNLKEFMILAKRFCDSENVFEELEYSYDSHLPSQRGIMNEGLMNLIDEDIKFMFHNLNGMTYFNIQPDGLKQIGGSMKSNHNSFMPVGLLGISQLTKNKEISFLFLKEALSYDIQSKIHGELTSVGFPINQSVIEKIRELDDSDYLYAWGPKNMTNEDEVTVVRHYNKQASSELVDMINNLDTCWKMNESLFQILKEGIVPYLKGDIEIDNAVQKIKSRLELYLFE